MGTCVTDFGYIAAEGARFTAARIAATIRQVAATGAFALNAYDAVKNFKKVSDVSSRALNVEEQQHVHLKDVYWPKETQFLNEFTQATDWEEQNVLAKRYAGRMWAPIASSYAKKLKEWECNKNRYCGTAYMRAIQELLVARATTKANVEAICDKIAFYEIQQISDTDFERRKQAIAMRQGLVGQASALMQSAVQGLAASGSEAAQAANAALQAYGYYGNRSGDAAGRRGGSPRTTLAPIEYRDFRTEEAINGLDYAPTNIVTDTFTDFDRQGGVPSSVEGTENVSFNETQFDTGFGVGFNEINAYNAGDGPGGMNIGDGK